MLLRWIEWSLSNEKDALRGEVKNRSETKALKAERRCRRGEVAGGEREARSPWCCLEKRDSLKERQNVTHFSART